MTCIIFVLSCINERSTQGVFFYIYTFQMKSPKTQKLCMEVLSVHDVISLSGDILLILQRWVKCSPRLVCEIPMN